MSEATTRSKVESIDREVQCDPVAILNAGMTIVARHPTDDIILTKRDGQIYRRMIQFEGDILCDPTATDEDDARRVVRKSCGVVEIHAENPYDE